MPLDMLGNLIVEQAASPGSSLVINLAGAVTGRRRFRALNPTGGSAFYIISDEAGMYEGGYGTTAVGTPDTLSRDTVLFNDAGTTARRPFTGTVYVWNTIPAEHAIYLHKDGYIGLKNADLRGMGSFNGGAASGLRNRIDNGRFDLWSFGTSFVSPAGPSFTADRWRVHFDGTGITQTVSRQAATDQSLLDRGIKYFLRWSKSVAGSGAAFRQLYIRMPDARMLAGRTITIGLRGAADTSRTVLALATQNFGTGGSPSSLVNMTIGYWTFTPTWQVFTATVDLPTIFGKTFGSNNDDYLQLTFNLPLNSADTIDIADVVLQEGTEIVDRMFERRPTSVEQLLCLRMREPMQLQAQAFAYSTTAVKVIGRTVSPMTKTPSVTFSGTGTVAQPGIGSFNSTTAPTVDAYDTATGAFRLDWTGFTGMTTSAPGYVSAMPSGACLSVEP